MKTRIILITIFALSTTFCYGQTRYYSSTKTIDLGNGVTYKCNNLYDGVDLYNSANRWTNVEWKNADGTTPTVDILRGDTRTYEITLDQHYKLRAAVNNAFSESQKDAIGDYRLRVNAYIDPFSGKIIEVEFNFGSGTPLGTIPPDVYRKVEIALLSNDIGAFTVTEAGKKLNYLILSWGHSFEK